MSKDNPVASLTKNDIKELKEVLSKYMSQFGKTKYRDKLYIIYDKLNAVETNNERPKKTKCICKTPDKCKCTFF